MTIAIVCLCVVAAWPISRPVVNVVNRYLDKKGN
jgi:hypothetical protein